MSIRLRFNKHPLNAKNKTPMTHLSGIILRLVMTIIIGHVFCRILTDTARRCRSRFYRTERRTSTLIEKFVSAFILGNIDLFSTRAYRRGMWCDRTHNSSSFVYVCLICFMCENA